MKKTPLAERFWTKVNKSGPDDCWLWIRTKSGGYGYVWGDDGKMKIACRVAWQLTYGDIPIGMSVLHTCDNPPCVNPAHLFLGTQLDNMRDAKTKGRIKNSPRYGEDSHLARLTACDVRNIRSECAKGDVSQTALAKFFAVSEAAISLIKSGENWAHLSE